MTTFNAIRRSLHRIEAIPSKSDAACLLFVVFGILPLFIVLCGCNNSHDTHMDQKMTNDISSSLEELTEDELSRRWNDETNRYVTAVNHFVEYGNSVGWEKVARSDEPKDTTAPMAVAVLDTIRRANESGQVSDLHDKFHRSHSPFFEMLGKNGQALPVAILLDDGRIVLRVGSPYETGHMVILKGDTADRLSPSIISVGRSPNREFFAVARSEGVFIQRGWDGPVSTVLKWPTGHEGVPHEYQTESIQGVPVITDLVPFNTGDRVLLVSPDGVFVMASDTICRLLPTVDQMREHFKWLSSEHPDQVLSYDLSMEHGAISPDGKLISAGHQSSLHYVFDSESYEIFAEIGPMSEYPHQVAFSADGRVIALNSCHFYYGKTIGLPVDLLPGITTAPYELDKRLLHLEDGSRVYSAVSRGDEFIIGDANGYLRAFDQQGKARWQHFIGSTVGDIDLSRDGRQLVVTTYAGFLCVLDLDTGKRDPSVIGNSTNHERRRWLFWKTEPRPLIW